MGGNFTYEDWKYEVANGDTRRGFDEWVAVNKAQEAARRRKRMAGEKKKVKFRVTVVAEMAFSQTCQFEVEAESEDEAQEKAYDMAFNDDPEWDPNPPERVGWSMQAEEAEG